MIHLWRSIFFWCMATVAFAAPMKTKNVVVVMVDGLRWQEVFRGADPNLLATKPIHPWLGDDKERRKSAQQAYAAQTAQERRQRLLPFFWGVMAHQGQLFGNRALGSLSQVVNPHKFSYPGYSETLVGCVDKSVDFNDNRPNPNPTVFEWLSHNPDFTGRIAAFGAWQVFDGIFNRDQAHFTVNSGFRPLTQLNTPRITLLNDLKRQLFRVLDEETYDAITFQTALEYLKHQRPRLLFIGLGETDEWAHRNDYPHYLDAAHQMDAYMRQLWDYLQSDPQYQNKTTLIILPDHGRGLGRKWTDHGEKTAHSEETWMAFMGPDTPALGERDQSAPQVHEAQIAATIAALLGENYGSEHPKAAPAIQAVLSAKPRNTSAPVKQIHLR